MYTLIYGKVIYYGGMYLLVSGMVSPYCGPPADKIQMISPFDGTGSWGCGVFSLPNWFHFQWSHNMQIIPISVKELFPVVIAVAIYGN